MTIFLSTLSFKLHMICKAPLRWPIAANQKNKNKNNEMKNEIKKIKTIIKKKHSEKNPAKLSWPMSAKSDIFFYSKRKTKNKITMAHECQI